MLIHATAVAKVMAVKSDKLINKSTQHGSHYINPAA